MENNPLGEDNLYIYQIQVSFTLRLQLSDPSEMSQSTCVIALSSSDTKQVQLK